MRMVACNLNEIESKGVYKKSDNFKILNEFAESEHTCVMIEDYTQKNAMCCAASLNTSIKRYHMTGIRAISRKDKVYLIRVNNK